MPAPPRVLERIVGALLPPACREEVLGDLCEGYKSPGQYLSTALKVIPLVIFSRVRRIDDMPMLVCQTLLTFASFLATALFFQSGADPLVLALPAIAAFLLITACDVWSSRVLSQPARIIAGSACAYLVGAVLLGFRINLLADIAALILVSALRLLVPVLPARYAGAASAPMPLAQKRSAVPIVLFSLFGAVLSISGAKLGTLEAAVVVVVVVLFVRRKE